MASVTAMRPRSRKASTAALRPICQRHFQLPSNAHRATRPAGQEGRHQVTVMKYLVMILILLCILIRVQQQRIESPSLACREFTFQGRINGGEEYLHELGAGLRLRLTPSLAPPDENWGWVIQVQPTNGDDDYAWPVNPPFHGENSQWLATGYHATAQQQFSHDHEVFFVLNQAQYERAAKLANDALHSREPQAAGEFLAILPRLRSAVLELKPVKYKTSKDGKLVGWLQFSVTVTVPASFELPSNTKSRNKICSLDRPPMFLAGLN